MVLENSPGCQGTIAIQKPQKLQKPYRETQGFKKFDALTAWVKSKENIFNLEPQNQRPQKPQRPQRPQGPMPTGHEKIHKQTVVWSKLHQWIFHIAASIKHEAWFTWNEPFQTFVCCIVEHFSIRCFESNITIDETVWTVYRRGIICICINCICCPSNFCSLTHLQWKASSWRTLELKSFRMDWVLVCFLSPGIVLEIKILSPDLQTLNVTAFLAHWRCATSSRAQCRWRATWWANLRINESWGCTLVKRLPRFNGNKQIHQFM